MHQNNSLCRHQFLAVVDLGDQADYRTEVWHRIDLDLPFRLTGRSGLRQLNAAHLRILAAVDTCTTKEMLVWLVEDGQPTRFFSGQRNVRLGTWTKEKARQIDDKIRPQFGHRQPAKDYLFVLKSNVNVWCHVDDLGDEESTNEELEDAVLDGILGSLDQRELTDSYVDDDEVYVSAEVRHEFLLELPFEPNRCSTEAQLGCIVYKARDVFECEFDDVEIDDLDVWLLDESGNATECVSGLLQVSEGTITMAEMTESSLGSLDALQLPTGSLAG